MVFTTTKLLKLHLLYPSLKNPEPIQILFILTAASLTAGHKMSPTSLKNRFSVYDGCFK